MNRAERRRRERMLEGKINNRLLNELGDNVAFIGTTCEKELTDIKSCEYPTCGRPISDYFVLIDSEEEGKYNIISLKELLINGDKMDTCLIFDSAYEFAMHCYYDFIGIEAITNLTDKVLYMLDSNPIKDADKMKERMFLGYLREKIRLIQPVNSSKSNKKGRKKKVNIIQEMRQLKVLFWDFSTSDNYWYQFEIGRQEAEVMRSINEYYKGEAVQDDNYFKPYNSFEMLDGKRIKELLEDK